MYRIVKSKLPEEYGIHKVIKEKDGELYVDAIPVLKSYTKAKLFLLLDELLEAKTHRTLDKKEVNLVHKTMWNENEIPFFEDISDEELETEFETEEDDNDYTGTY